MLIDAQLPFTGTFAAMSAGGSSRNRSSRTISVTPFKGKSKATVLPFEPCAATPSHFLFSHGSTVYCLLHDTLALERKFQNHDQEILFICVDIVSERGAGRLVVTYDKGQTAMVWDILTGEQIARFQSYDPIKVAAWMRNGNIAFGTSQSQKRGA